jgi:hypothetical protein
MFMPWLLEQEDRDDEIGYLYKMIYADHNNGCLNSLSSMKYIINHFINVHPKQFLLLRSHLIMAIKAYEDPLAK